ncbi:MAG TPA: NAD-dependent deacylase [Pyrinomonadaceae bacterium]|nr:NAD-dependent deacylase [Pyrinomonadaceae bacterium]
MQPGTQPSINEDLRERFRAARRVFVLTGAGVSAESGVPTFRGGGGSAVWKAMPFEVISSARMAERDLPAVWEWFDYRRDIIREVKPNPAHEAIARWQRRFQEFTLATQNIDGLHASAGSRGVLELHGNLWRARCKDCDTRRDLRAQDDRQRPPVCYECGGWMRPDVVLFGEMLPAGVFERAAMHAAECDLCFVVGTSALVYPAAGLPEIASRAGAYVVEVNPDRTPLSDICDEIIQGRAGEVLPEFEKLLAVSD